MQGDLSFAVVHIDSSFSERGTTSIQASVIVSVDRTTILFSFKGYAIGSARKHQQMEILELSVWSNSSSDREKSSVTFDVPAVWSIDRPNEFYRVGSYHHDTGPVGRQIQKLDVKEENTSWIELDNVTIPAHLATTHMAVSVDNGRLFIFTGQLDHGSGPATRSSAYLNLATKQWIDLPDVPEARHVPSAVIANNHVHLFGGAKADGQTPSLDYWLLDLDNLDRGWLPGPSMPQSGAHGHGALIDNWIYSFAFGDDHSSTKITQPGVFKIHSKSTNLNSSRWIRSSDIPHSVSHATSIVLNERWILLVGGIGPFSHAQLFDTYLDHWRSLSSLPTAMKNPLLWMNEEQSMIYLQSSSSSTNCLNYRTHIIWSHQPRTERCLFYTDLACTTRQLQRTPLAQYGQSTELRWTSLFSNIYLLNMPKSVDRLRQAWSELSRMDLTSITLFEAFRIDHMNRTPVLIREDLLWPEKMKQWKAKNDERSIRHHALSCLSVKVIFMNLWTRNSKKKNSISLETQPVLMMEDDLRFVRSKEETLAVVERTLAFLDNHSEIEWDLLYLGYRNIEATRTYQISGRPTIHLWRASRILSNTAFIVNKDRRTIDRLNQCYLTRLGPVDQAISYCAKSQRLRAFLIEPKLVRAAPGFSLNLNHFQDYTEHRKEHTLGNHTPPAAFNSSTKD